MYDFLTPVIMLRDPELIKSIAITHFDMFTDHRTYGQNNMLLLFLRGDKWRQMRSIASPAFTSKFFSVLNNAINQPKTTWLVRVFKLQTVNEKIMKFFRNIVETTIRTRIQKDIARPDMLQLMMECRDKEEGNSKKITIEEMAALAFSFFFAGYETVSSLMSFVTHEIARNENYRKDCRMRLISCWKTRTANLQYAERFRVAAALTGAKPYVVKKGDLLWIPVYALHHDIKYFKEPEKFNPDRFIGDEKKHIDKTGLFCRLV
ncbi:cytochrome P450 9e2-like [Harpegnathos saltator]|uniref:cytochrome P450 9e2-like n=1 Tax=Harpegnathos saltator TaxID=610380 RepID=UPI000DBEE88D|nr:cytochrome P450 9e2-like [Harpegnathos saltator]